MVIIFSSRKTDEESKTRMLPTKDSIANLSYPNVCNLESGVSVTKVFYFSDA